MRTVLQVPMSLDLKSAAVKAAKDSGFSSLQEVVRLMLTKLASKKLTIAFQETSVPMTTKNEKRYTQMSKDFKTGKNIISYNNIDEMFADLDES